MLVAIYIEPPVDVTAVPQSYTIHCITTGEEDNITNVALFLERHSLAYYSGSNTPPVTGYDNMFNVTTLDSATLTYDYSEVLQWNADRVEKDKTEFSAQGLSSSNGDHDWACAVYYSNKNVYDDLQSYIRGIVVVVLIPHKLFSSSQLPTSLFLMLVQ